MKHLSHALLSLFLLIAIPLVADECKTMPLQLSLIPKVQTSRPSTTINGLRLNLIYGVSANLNGFDLGIANQVNGDLRGGQFGLFNIHANSHFLPFMPIVNIGW